MYNFYLLVFTPEALFFENFAFLIHLLCDNIDLLNINVYDIPFVLLKRLKIVQLNMFFPEPRISSHFCSCKP